MSGCLPSHLPGRASCNALRALPAKQPTWESLVAATQDSLPRLTRAGCENRNEFPPWIFYEALPLEKNPPPGFHQAFTSARWAGLKVVLPPQNPEGASTAEFTIVFHGSRIHCKIHMEIHSLISTRKSTQKSTPPNQPRPTCAVQGFVASVWPRGQSQALGSRLCINLTPPRLSATMLPRANA